ncbi:hypothetical protein H114_03446 [Streptomyces gancidicus BKS 13-15]|uniref:Uncharacterized protein n=1 Tax=Streptomyces gancidicus BKS 13-15 TaxID=1284664 RepID=M3D275_STREZ|nr:hypothetical protein H114_03446 [Streptomyces gancidicus BKS 13-15]
MGAAELAAVVQLVRSPHRQGVLDLPVVNQSIHREGPSDSSACKGTMSAVAGWSCLSVDGMVYASPCDPRVMCRRFTRRGTRPLAPTAECGAVEVRRGEVTRRPHHTAVLLAV